MVIMFYIILSARVYEFILVNASKPDKSDIISKKMGKTLAKDLKAACYLECSPLAGDGVDQVIHNAVDIVVSKKKSKREQRNKPCDEVSVAAQLIKHVKACKSL